MARKTTRNGRTVYIPGNAPDKFFYSLSKAQRYERTCGGWAVAKASTKSSRARNDRGQFVKAAKNPADTHEERRERDRLFPVFMRAAPTDPEDREEYMEALYLLPVEHLREADPSNLIEVADAYNDSTGWPPEDSW